MDNNKPHDYRDTIEEAKDIDIEPNEAQKRKKEAEIAFEALAASTSMGLIGMEETVAELMQVELSEQLLYNFSLDPPPDGNKEEDIKK